MKHIQPDELKTLLPPFEGRDVYVHVEVTPGAYVRNVKISIVQAYLAGEGPYRVALRLAGGGWIRVEGLTHMEVDELGRVLIAGHDEKGRLTSALELSREPFPE